MKRGQILFAIPLILLTIASIGCEKPKVTLDPPKEVTINSKTPQLRRNTVPIAGKVNKDAILILSLERDGKEIRSEEPDDVKSGLFTREVSLPFPVNEPRDGTYSIVVKPFDDKTGEYGDTMTVIVDTTAPHLTIGTVNGQRVSDSPIRISDSPIRMTGTIEQNAEEARIVVEGTPREEGDLQFDKSGAFSKRLDVSKWDKQSIVVYIEGRDSVGNDGKSNRITLDVHLKGDGIPPSNITIISPEDGLVTREAEIEIAGILSYVNLGNLRLSARGQQVNFSKTDGRFSFTVQLREGKNSIQILVNDTTNPEIRAQETLTITRDTTKPYFVLNGKRYEDAADAEVLLNADDITALKVADNTYLSRVHGQSTGRVREYPLPATDLQDGSNEITVADIVGNSATVTVIKYRTLQLQITSPQDGLITKSEQIAVEGTVSEGYGSKVVKIDNNTTNLGDDGSFSYGVTLSEGENTVTVSTNDDSGMLISQARIITRDITKPYFVINGKNYEDGAEIPLREDATLSGQVQDNVQLATFRNQPVPEGSKRQPFKIRASALKLRPNQITAIDQAGNQATLIVHKYGNLKLRAAELPAYTNQQNLAISGTVTGGWRQVTVKVNNTPAQVRNGRFTSTLPLVEGKNSITVSASDEDGNQASQVLRTTVDRTPPICTYAEKRGVSSIERKIAEGDFTVDIDDDSGIEVRLNGKKLSVPKGRTWTISLSDLTLEDKDLLGTLIAQDLAGNTLDVSIKAQPIDDPWKALLEAYEEHRYADAWNVLDAIEKEHGQNATALLFRAMIIYHKDVLKAEDNSIAYGRLQEATNHLELALARAAEYPRDSDNIHYNRYYLGLCYYKQYILARQEELGDNTVQRLKTQAIERFGSFISTVGNRVPSFKKDAQARLAELKGQK